MSRAAPTAGFQQDRSARHVRVPPPPAPGGGNPGAPRAVILAVCCTALFMVGVDNTVVNIGLPAIGQSLHAPLSGLQWTSASYTVVLASLLLFSGALADRIGRRTVFQVGLALFTLGSWLCSLAPGLSWLIAFRVVQGAGGSMLNPAALGIITNTFTRPAERARAIGVWDGVFGVSMALGPVAGGVLVAATGWRGIFWVNIPVGLAGIAATALLVPESRSATARRADPVGQALVVAVLATLAFAIIQGPSYGWLSPRIFACYMACEAAVAVLVAWESRRAEPLIDFRLFKSVPFSAANLTAVAAITAVSGFLFLTTLYLQDVRGFSVLRAGLTILPMPAAMAVCAPLAGRMVARRGSRAPLAIAGAALGLSCAALSLLSATSGPAFLLVTYALFGVGAGMVNPAITNGIMSGVPRSQAGVASGINSSSRQVGQSLGVAVTGSLVATSLRGGMRAGFLPAAHTAWWVMAGCGYLVLLLAIAAGTRWPASTAARRPAPVTAPRPAVAWEPVDG